MVKSEGGVISTFFIFMFFSFLKSVFKNLILIKKFTLDFNYNVLYHESRLNIKK